MLFAHRNQQYSIYAYSNSGGAVVERIAYTAYGQPTFMNAAGTVQSTSRNSIRYSYTGREWDASLQPHHFRARWMGSVTGRFLGREPIGYVDGRLLYVANFSIGGKDPTGSIVLKDNAEDPTGPMRPCKAKGLEKWEEFRSNTPNKDDHHLGWKNQTVSGDLQTHYYLVYDWEIQEAGPSPEGHCHQRHFGTLSVVYTESGSFQTGLQVELPKAFKPFKLSVNAASSWSVSSGSSTWFDLGPTPGFVYRVWGMDEVVYERELTISYRSDPLQRNPIGHDVKHYKGKTGTGHGIYVCRKACK